MDRGFFITFEGTEGSGKTTQAKLLASALLKAKLDVVLTREPGGTLVGDAIRDVLLSDVYTSIDPHTEALLHTGSRAEHVAKLIAPSIQRGIHVISDRFFDSTLAYQGGGAGLDMEALRQMQEFAVANYRPDLTFLISIDVDKGLLRRLSHDSKGPSVPPGNLSPSRQLSMFSVAAGVNRIDSAEYSYHLKVAETFHELSGLEPHRWVVIDGDQTKEKVHEQVLAQLKERIAYFEFCLK